MSKLYENKKTAENYNSARSLPEHAISILTDVLTNNTPVGEITSVLDLGGGTGRFSFLLHEVYRCPVYILDPSVDMLNQADISAFDSIHRVAANAENIPFKTGTFDLVFMSQVFHHLENRPAALSGIRDVLPDGGYLVIRNGTQETDGTMIWKQFFPETIEYDEGRIPYQRDIIDTISNNGFSFVRSTTGYQRFTASAQEYYEKISGRGLSALIAISDDAFRSGLDRLRNWVEKQPPDSPVFEPIEHFIFLKE